MRAIITGVTGQDGVYLAKLLISKGYEVIGLLRSYSGSTQNLKILGIEDEVEFINCDLMDLSSVMNIINKYNPDEIYNLAAQSSVYISFQEPIGTISFNTTSVLNLLEAIKNINKNIKFYQASSSDMYGNVEHLPISIDSQMKPLSPYAVSKASAYWTVSSYRESYDLYAVNGILFNHESILRTERFFMKKIVSNSVDIYLGKRDILEVGDIDIKRDFGYAPKYVEAMWLMLQQEKPKDYLICSGKSIKLRNIIEFIFKKLNISKEKLVVNESFFRPSEIKDIYGDNSAALKELKWEYDINFFDVVDELIQYELKHR